MDLSALESASKALEGSLDSWSIWLWVFTTAVAIGLVVEYAPEFIEFFGKRAHDAERKKLRTLIGGVLITAGVTGELVIEIKLSEVETRLRITTHRIEALLNKEAGDARKAAGGAIGSAAQANERAAFANERASRTEASLAGANERSAQANERAANAEREAARLNKSAEEERLARLRIEERLKPRRLSQEQRDAISVMVSAFRGTDVRLTTVVSDSEGAQFAKDFLDVLSEAGWHVGGIVTTVFEPPLPVGVIIQIGDIHNVAAVALQRVLRAEGIDARGQVVAGMESSAITLIIGIKP